MESPQNLNLHGESEECFRLLVESVKDYAIFMLDPGGHVLSWNSGAERIKGYKAEEIVGKHFSVFYPEEALRKNWPAHELDVARASGRFEDEGWRVRKDGSIYWANVLITALRDSQGNLRGFAKVARDLTARREAEEQARQLASERAARLEAESANRHKGDFLAMLAHELRNPLAPVMSGLHILHLAGTDPQALEQVRGMIERQIRHLTRLVDDLLDVSRITRGKVAVEREALDLADLVRITTEDRRRTLEEAGLRLTLNLPEEPVWVAGDPTRLAQCLGNLLDNTIKFKNGGDEVTVSLNADPAGRAALVVRDNGIGIEPGIFPRLFEPFNQADRSLDRSRGGLGLGLAVVKGLVELHGGEVQASSAGPGKGAAFTILLPLKEEPPALSGKPPAAPAQAAEPLRILIVEDNRDSADSLRLLLRLYGHEVAVAYTGPEGLRLAQALRPDIVLCDLGLPGLDGYRVAAELRRDPATAQARLIAVTGYGQEEDLRRSAQAGFDRHLVKPVNPEALLEVLTRRLA